MSKNSLKDNIKSKMNHLLNLFSNKKDYKNEGKNKEHDKLNDIELSSIVSSASAILDEVKNEENANIQKENVLDLSSIASAPAVIAELEKNKVNDEPLHIPTFEPLPQIIPEPPTLSSIIKSKIETLLSKYSSKTLSNAKKDIINVSLETIIDMSSITFINELDAILETANNTDAYENIDKFISKVNNALSNEKNIELITIEKAKLLLDETNIFINDLYIINNELELEKQKEEIKNLLENIKQRIHNIENENNIETLINVSNDILPENIDTTETVMEKEKLDEFNIHNLIETSLSILAKKEENSLSQWLGNIISPFNQTEETDVNERTEEIIKNIIDLKPSTTAEEQDANMKILQNINDTKIISKGTIGSMLTNLIYWLLSKCVVLPSKMVKSFIGNVYKILRGEPIYNNESELIKLALDILANENDLEKKLALIREEKQESGLLGFIGLFGENKEGIKSREQPDTTIIPFDCSSKTKKLIGRLDNEYIYYDTENNNMGSCGE